MSEKLIMLVGNIGCGKSVAAEILTKFGFKEDMFAAPLKEFARIIGFTETQVYGTQAEKLSVNQFWGVSGREFLQKFGSEVCRNALPKAIPNMQMNARTLWARVVEQKIFKYPLLVMSDGRFEDEAKLVKDRGGIIIRITRNPQMSKCNGEFGRCCKESNATVTDCKNTCGGKNVNNTDHTTHVSETSMALIEEDYRINNDGTLEDLEIALKQILQAEGLDLKQVAPDLRDVSTSTIVVTCIMTALTIVGMFASVATSLGNM